MNTHSYLDLLVSLTWRDIRVRYRQSALGLAWAVLLPLSMMIVFTFVFSRAIRMSGQDLGGIPYPLYAFAGLVPWTLFSASLSSAVNSLVANRNLVTKVYFPREVFPFSCILGSLVDFGVAMTVLLVMTFGFHVAGSFTYVAGPGLLLFPLVILILVVLTMGLSLALSMANLFYRDVRQLFTVAIQLWMFVSAVVVPLPTGDGMMAHALRLNPLAHLMEASRSTLLTGSLPDPSGLAYAATWAIVVLAAGWWAFRRASWRFAECI